MIQLQAKDNLARAGMIHTLHGSIETPFFMTVGTLAAVKILTIQQLKSAKAPVLLANTYHLALRPGDDVVKQFGGLASFMGWNGPTLTDSGGFQVFSLAHRRKISEEGVHFQSHHDGSPFFLSPERSVEIQQNLGADFFMCFDECPPGGANYDAMFRSIERTNRWAKRCKDAWTTHGKQSLFGIVQGGIHESLRTICIDAITELDFPGNAIGGVSVGESSEDVQRIVHFAAPKLPADKPRYLMGVGRPEDILHAVGCGVDMFDCVMPTRNARHAHVFTWEGRLNLRNLKHQKENKPIMEDCDCETCKTVSRGYLRHLFIADELLGQVLAAVHNIRFYHRMMEEIRTAILEQRFYSYQKQRLDQLQSRNKD